MTENSPSPTSTRFTGVIPLVVWLVWVGCTLNAFWYIRTYGVPLPYNDEWYYVGVVVGEEPLTINWLWYQHNEHRIPWAKLTFVPILRLGNYDYRIMMYFNVGVLASAAAILMLAARRARGTTLLTDAVYPLFTLSLNQENHLWAFQIAFCQFAWFMSVVFALMMTRPHGPQPSWRILALGVLAWLLPGTGGPGLGVLPGIMLWILAEGVLAWRIKRWRTVFLSSTFLLGCLLWMVAYFTIDYHRVKFINTPPNLFGVFRSTLLFLGNTPGAFQQTVHVPPETGLPLLGVIVALLIVVGLGVLVWRREQSGPTLIPLLALAISLGGLSVGIGYSRSGGDLATAPRYATLALPWAWWLLVLATTLPLWSARMWRGFLLIAAIWAYPQAARFANYVGQLGQNANQELKDYLQSGAPFEVVLNQIFRTSITPNLEEVRKQLYRLQQAKVKAIQGIAPDLELRWDGPQLPLPEPLGADNPIAWVTLPDVIKPQAIRVEYEISQGYVSFLVIGWKGLNREATFTRWMVARQVTEPRGTATLWLGPTHDFEELSFTLLTPNQQCRILKLETMLRRKPEDQD